MTSNTDPSQVDSMVFGSRGLPSAPPPGLVAVPRTPARKQLGTLSASLVSTRLQSRLTVRSEGVEISNLEVDH